MKPEELLDSMEYIDADLVEKADHPVRIKRRAFVRWGAMAACLCLIAVGVFAWHGHQKPTQSGEADIRHWSEGMVPGDYFADSSTAPTESSASLVMPPYAVSISLNGERDMLEAEGVLPAVPDHQDHDFEVDFNGDGSLYKVSFLWMRRGEGREAYSDLQLTAAPHEIHEVSDVITVYTDENGEAVAPNITVTERDGIFIYGEGAGKSKKLLTWQTEDGWYQLSSLNFSEDATDLVALLDWFWANPLNLEQFNARGQETIRFSSREEYPEAFAGEIPDFAALGYSAESERVSLTTWDDSSFPVWFEGIYTRGETRIRWSVSSGADRDAWAACLGRPGEITEEKINEALEERNYFTVFLDGPRMATLTVEQGGASDAWEIVQAMQR